MTENGIETVEAQNRVTCGEMSGGYIYACLVCIHDRIQI